MKVWRSISAKFGGITRIIFDAAVIIALITGAAYAFTSTQTAQDDRPVSIASKR